MSEINCALFIQNHSEQIVASLCYLLFCAYTHFFLSFSQTTQMPFPIISFSLLHTNTYKQVNMFNLTTLKTLQTKVLMKQKQKLLHEIKISPNQCKPVNL